MAADFCRLCLRPIDKAKSTDLVTETTKLAMLKEFLPEMNLDISENTQVCSSCIEELETSYNFKHGVVVNETNIQTKLEENDLKKIDLKLMLDDVAKKEVKTDDYVCRTCFSICRTPSISLFDSPTNMMPYSFVKKMCQVVFELEFIAADKPVLCDDCWETLQTVYNFRKCCLRTDKKLRIFVANKNITKVNNDEFKEFAEENPPKDDAEDSSDDELDEYIKEEPVDADEMKFDPDEASCSSSSVKVKKETAVKSESELNSEDEDMEDEPELLDPKTIKSEASELDGEECKMEIGDVKVDAEGEGSAGPSGKGSLKGRRGFHFNLGQASICKPGLSQVRDWSSQNNPKKSQKYCVKRKDNIIGHLPNYHPPNGIAQMFSCAQCPYKTPKKSHLSQHILNHQRDRTIKPFACTHCSFKSSYKKSLNRHLFINHPDDTVEILKCTQCSFKTGYYAALITHLRIHQPDDMVQIFSCNECSFKTRYQGSINNHLLIHQPDDLVQVFFCNQCSHKTRYKAGLKKHMRTHLPEDTVKIFSCTECSYKTRHKSSLQRHTKLIHSFAGSVETLRCTHCSFETKHKGSFRVHAKVHLSADASVEMFHCPQCSYMTKFKGNLKKHERIHFRTLEHEQTLHQ